MEKICLAVRVYVQLPAFLYHPFLADHDNLSTNIWQDILMINVTFNLM